MKIVLASKKPKKATELERIAKGKIEIICVKDIPEAEGIPQAEENGTTFIENARIKAKYWAEKLNMPALGEDSGIEIEALNGAPGVYTKRCMSKFCPGENINVDKPEEVYPRLLDAMKKSGNPSKKAYWVSAIVLAFPKEEKIIEAVNSLEGEMCECAGKKKFGFDQYFKPVGQFKTLAEMEPEEKDKIGPRQKSFNEILEKI